MKLLLRAGAVLGTIVLFYWYDSRLKRFLSRKRERQANKIVEALKARGYSAEVCPECRGKGETHYFSWRLDVGQYCAKCDGMGFLYELNTAEKKDTM